LKTHPCLGFTTAGFGEPLGLIAVLVVLFLIPRRGAEFWVNRVWLSGHDSAGPGWGSLRSRRSAGRRTPRFGTRNGPYCATAGSNERIAKPIAYFRLCSPRNFANRDRHAGHPPAELVGRRAAKSRASIREPLSGDPSPSRRSSTARRLRTVTSKTSSPGGRTVKDEQIAELLYQALETEKGGIQIYETALTCALNAELKKEWEEYLEQTRNHERIVREAMEALELDPEQETPGRLVVRHIGESLVEAMEMALEDGPPEAAQLVACEAVVLAETKDHLNWELIHAVTEKAKGRQREALKAAYEQVEEQEDQHLYHTTGYCRELWIESLGMPAVLPPPEEEKDVKTAIGAARAKMTRKQML
jgi:rubrerythrin